MAPFLGWLHSILGRRKKKSAPVVSPPRYLHRIDHTTLTCSRCGAQAVYAAHVPCRDRAKERVAAEAYEFHHANPAVYQPVPLNQEWADAFGPLSETFRVPEPPAEPFAGGGGTFGGAGASASWDTGPASDPSSFKTPAADSPSFDSSSSSSESESTSSSSESESPDFSDVSGGSSSTADEGDK